jgi:hypothetical protein
MNGTKSTTAMSDMIISEAITLPPTFYPVQTPPKDPMNENQLHEMKPVMTIESLYLHELCVLHE